MISNVEIKKLKPNEIDKFIELINLFEDVFEMKNFRMPEKNYLDKLLSRDDFFVFVAIESDRVIGGLTSYTMQQYYATEPLVYIFDLAVKTEMQRTGVGKKLIEGINTYCKEIGVEEVMVQADLADDYAIDFYKKTGGIPESVVHFGYPLKDLKIE